jgi:uncharacterized membrane protein YhaH (DUF805 family)
MVFINWLVDFFRSLKFLFFEFDGRIGRTVHAVGILITVFSFLASALLLPNIVFGIRGNLSDLSAKVYWLYFTFVLLLHFRPYLALTAKRTHDFGEALSDNLIRYLLSPGFALDIYFREGDSGENTYGYRGSL